MQVAQIAELGNLTGGCYSPTAATIAALHLHRRRDCRVKDGTTGQFQEFAKTHVGRSAP